MLAPAAAAVLAMVWWPGLPWSGAVRHSMIAVLLASLLRLQQQASLLLAAAAVMCLAGGCVLAAAPGQTQ
jgi:hypothetical protein